MPRKQQTAPSPSLSRFIAWMRIIARGMAPTGWLLLVIVAMAALIRLVLIHYGLPMLLYEDEPIYYQHALGFGLGNWIIPYFKKPPFFLYLYSGFYYLAYLYSPFMEWKDYVETFWRDPTYIATVGRTVSIAFAAGSVYLLARLGQHAFSAGVGLAAAFLLAVDPTHLRISPVVISDIPSLFFIIASAWTAVMVSERGRLKDYVLCAFMITLAMSFKYNVFAVCFLLAGHFMRYHERRITTAAFWKSALSDRRLWLSLAMIPAMYLALNPMILMNFKAFWFDLNWEKRHMLNRNTLSTAEALQFLPSMGTVLLKLLPRALGWSLYVLGLLGLGWMSLRYPRRAIVLLSFPLVFLVVMMQFRLINAKYLLPLFPFFFLGCAVLLQDLAGGLLKKRSPWLQARWTQVAFTVLVIMAAFPSLKDSAEYVTIYTRQDTRSEATRYIGLLAAPNDRFLMEPDSVTMDNHLFRSAVVISDYTGRHFRSITQDEHFMATLNLQKFNPRYVVMDFSEMESREDKQGRTYYEVPHPNPGYYRALLRDYQFKEIFAPYTISLSDDQMARELESRGFEKLYARIQGNKTTRERPGPLLLLLEKKAVAAAQQG